MPQPPHLLEAAVGEQVPLDALQRLVRVVIRLLHQAQLLALVLVEPHRHHVLLLEPLQRQDEQLGVVLVVERREGDGREPEEIEREEGACG